MNITPNDSNNAIVSDLQVRIKELEYDCAELVRNNEELSERVKKLASRQPSWPKGYRQQYRPRFNNKKA
jgi:hypothetical protein|tara:strand:+ start:1010 stop:1216 length:207 start_codon:yes stop_codon:yes gene_type:complete